ncbi:MAG: amidohydrolase family protein [Chitinophagaceae bacterium]|nr:amidohydrolase family protein [Chitinophagaceae bacterium]
MPEEQYYSIEDFYKVKKADAHVHYNAHSEAITNLAKRCNFTLLSINTNIPGFPSIAEQQDYVVKHPAFRKTLFHLTTFDSANIYDNDWLNSQLKYLQNSIDNGALGFKVWKDIGMSLKSANNEFIFIDDAVFKPYFDFAEKHNVPVLGHIGEPKNCWLPLEQMTVINDRNYFRQHPEFHMYLHPEFPSYDYLTNSYKKMLEQHPHLSYIGAHFGSLEWSAKEVAKRLDTFPHMAVDMAERISHMQYQTAHDREQVRNFFIKYQDRIIYGTDLIVEDTADFPGLEKRAHDMWLKDWRYFVTGDEMTSPLLELPFRGLQLPKEVVDKIYLGNARRWYRIPV